MSVIGLSNVFLADDGFGPLVVEVFRCEYEYGSEVEVLDLGTPGLDLAPYLHDRELIVVIDAVQAALAPGTLSIFREIDFVSSRAKLRIIGHDPGLWDLLVHLRLADGAREELVVVGLAPQSCSFGDAISPGFLIAVSEAAAMVAALLIKRGIDCRHHSRADRPNLWRLPLSHPERVAG